MDKIKFTALIGSIARGTGDNHSDIDIDILRIGHRQSVMRPKNIDRRLPISYVDYDSESFFRLYNEGSLFLYHALFEGKLISGDRVLWGKLKDNFVVSEDFINCTHEYIEVLKYIDAYPYYECSSVPYLSNIFKCLKNIGIFKLAKISVTTSKRWWRWRLVAV